MCLIAAQHGAHNLFDIFFILLMPRIVNRLSDIYSCLMFMHLL